MMLKYHSRKIFPNKASTYDLISIAENEANYGDRVQS